jgi:hypothetical protein
MYYNNFGCISYSLSIVAGLGFGLLNRPIAESLGVPTFSVWTSVGILLITYSVIWWHFFDFKQHSLENSVEQAGTGQSATRPESKSEGSDKPQPESEGRSR